MSGRPSANALAETLVKALAQRGMTVAAAESCTGGMVTAAITSVSGASAVLEYSAGGQRRSVFAGGFPPIRQPENKQRQQQYAAEYHK